MSVAQRTFHESWYRIADQLVGLKPNIDVSRQLYRGERWYVLRDPLTNQFYRLRPSAYRFVARLDQTKSVESVWREVVHENPDDAPGQEEIIQLLAQLYHANLLHYQLPADSKQLFDRYKKRKNKILKATLASVMFFRVPLFDPDALLKRMLPFIKLLFSFWAAVAWVVLVLAGVKVAIDNAADLGQQSQAILAPSNLFLLYVGMVFIKTLHEFGHAFAVRRFGGEVHTMGVMFLIFTPIPYMDATSAWSFRSKWKRALVGAAGMLVEIFVAVIALFVWAYTGPGVLNSLAYNMVFIASVSTLLFNINPLLRFDGYYILSDVLDIPNLHAKSREQLVYLIEKYIFRVKDAPKIVDDTKEAYILAIFGVASGVYRVFIFAVILLFVADQFLLAGILMALVCVVVWVVKPMKNLVTYLSENTRIERVRRRAQATVVGFTIVMLVFLGLIPYSNHFIASGILQSSDYAKVVNGSGGYLSEVVKPSGSSVRKGDVLLRFTNKELALSLGKARSRYNEVLALRQQALMNGQVDLEPVERLKASAYKRLQKLEFLQSQLTIRAEAEGIWVAPTIENQLYRWTARGSVLGEVVNIDQFHFVSVIPQNQASSLFKEPILGAEVKLRGQVSTPITVTDFKRIPAEQARLPSMALGWAAGGDIAVDTSDASGVTALEPFYELHAYIPESNVLDVVLFHGHTGKIRFQLERRPLLSQWWRSFRQLLQKRYQI